MKDARSMHNINPVQRTIENPGRFLWSQFWSDTYEIWTQGVDIYPLSGIAIFFRSGARIKSYAALNFSDSSGSFGQYVQNSSVRAKIWQVRTLYDASCKYKKNNHV